MESKQSNSLKSGTLNLIAKLPISLTFDINESSEVVKKANNDSNRKGIDNQIIITLCEQ